MTEIVEAVLASKKYASLYKPMVDRICKEEYQKYANDKERIKAVKNTLHSMFGAYLSQDIFKKACKMMDEIDSGVNIEKVEKILQLHASTKERLPHMHAIYEFIFASTGQVNSVLDLACGFNPFSIGVYQKNKCQKLPSYYYAFDIDNRIADLNNRYLSYIGLPTLAGCCDLICETPKVEVDVVFLFKILPLIERQDKGRAASLLGEIRAKHIVVTYPTRSLSGKKKGMLDFYSTAFEDIVESVNISNLSNMSKISKNVLRIVDKATIGNELVYVIFVENGGNK